MSLAQPSDAIYLNTLLNADPLGGEPVTADSLTRAQVRGGELAELRKLANVTREQLGRMIGVDASTIADCERGYIVVPIATRRLLLATIVPHYGGEHASRLWNDAQRDGFLTFDGDPLPYLVQRAWHSHCIMVNEPFVQLSWRLVFYDLAQLHAGLRPSRAERLQTDLTALLDRFDPHSDTELSRALRQTRPYEPLEGTGYAEDATAARDLARALVDLGRSRQR